MPDLRSRLQSWRYDALPHREETWEFDGAAGARVGGDPGERGGELFDLPSPRAANRMSALHLCVHVTRKPPRACQARTRNCEAARVRAVWKEIPQTKESSHAPEKLSTGMSLHKRVILL